MRPRSIVYVFVALASGALATGTAGATGATGGRPPLLPLGLDAGMSYIHDGSNVEVSGYVRASNGHSAPTIQYVPTTYNPAGCNPNNQNVDLGIYCTVATQGHLQLNSFNGYRGIFDGDYGLHTNYGFYHSEYGSGVTDYPYVTGPSDRFDLPAGTACGFHHTYNSGESTCMGHDAWFDCPKGWVKRRHFDMSSGAGYYAWCEYEDPNHTSSCKNNACVGSQIASTGITIGIYSDTDAAGTTVLENHACPPGTTRTPFFDDGRSSGQGLSWCRP